MKILMVHPHDLFSHEEPWTTRIKSIAAELRRRGHEIKMVYFPLNFRNFQRRFHIKGIEFIPLSRKVGLRSFLSNIRFLCRESRWADIIHFQKCFYHAAMPALIAAYFNNKPIHYDWDDWEVKIFHYAARQPRLVSMFLSALERFIPCLCDSVSVSSTRLEEECLRCGVHPAHMVRAPVGADLEQFHPAISGLRIRELYNIDGTVVSYMGQLHGGQYAEQFIRAAKIILNQKPDTVFMLVGGGYRLEELKQMAVDLDCSQRFIFTGALPHQDIPLYLAATDIAVACFQDNDITRCKSPLKIAEYLSSGRAIVASGVGEVRHMLGGAGVLTTAGDPLDLAAGILKLLDDEPLRKRLSSEARKRAEDSYNWANTTSGLLNAYILDVAHRNARQRRKRNESSVPVGLEKSSV